VELPPIYIELYNDLAPQLVENFEFFCHNNENELSFVGMHGERNTIGNHLLLQMPFPRTKFGAYFPTNEWNSKLRHDKRGVISYLSQGNIINGNWAIFYQSQPLQDAVFAPFGQISEKSLEILDKLEEVGTKSDVLFTTHTITLINCQMIEKIPE
jgi:cyclophilin family peptidyl-prolyl cis-trans isomerase